MFPSTATLFRSRNIIEGGNPRTPALCLAGREGEGLPYLHRYLSKSSAPNAQLVILLPLKTKSPLGPEKQKHWNKGRASYPHPPQLPRLYRGTWARPSALKRLRDILNVNDIVTRGHPSSQPWIHLKLSNVSLATLVYKAKVRERLSGKEKREKTLGWMPP